jgi:hypothetical protein
MTGAGIGVEYSDLRGRNTPVVRTGGIASGPVPHMQAINEIGRAAVQGGDRRAAIWAGLAWDHPDIEEFIHQKDWPEEIRALKRKNPLFPAPMDQTNISTGLNDEFFAAYHMSKHPKHDLARSTYWSTVYQMVTTAEPGFSVNLGKFQNENLRNAPVCAGTYVLTDRGYRPVGEIVDQMRAVWTGKQWASGVVFKKTGSNVPVVKVQMTGGRVLRCDPTHEFLVERYKGYGKKRTSSSASIV